MWLVWYCSTTMIFNQKYAAYETKCFVWQQSKHCMAARNVCTISLQDSSQFGLVFCCNFQLNSSRNKSLFVCLFSKGLAWSFVNYGCSILRRFFFCEFNCFVYRNSDLTQIFPENSVWLIFLCFSTFIHMDDLRNKMLSASSVLMLVPLFALFCVVLFLCQRRQFQIKPSF